MASLVTRLLMPPRFLLFVLSVKSVDIECREDFYGKPMFNDGYRLLSLLPSARDANTRLFVEQQLREGVDHELPGVNNIYSDAMVQTPKYWSYS